MEILIAADAAEGAALAADIVERTLRERPAAVLGLATGGSTVPVYQELARRHQDGLSFRAATCFLLDEYVGLARTHPASYRRFIDEHFTTLVDVPPERVHAPDGEADDLAGECGRYEEAIRESGGVDLQLLGIGRNGHIGFNEPGSSLASSTRIKTLSVETREDNARFFAASEEVPPHVLTQGIGTILRARHLLLIAFGNLKAPAVAAALEGPVTASVPASALQLHPHATVIADRLAAADLRGADQYREAYARKPTWQSF